MVTMTEIMEIIDADWESTGGVRAERSPAPAGDSRPAANWYSLKRFATPYGSTYERGSAEPQHP